MDKFQLVKERVSILQAIELYGRDKPIKMGRRYFIKSPWLPGQKTASCVIYVDTNSFYDFGTAQGGDVVKLISTLLGIRPIDAANRLIQDFHLAIGRDSPQRENPALLRQKELDLVATTIKYMLVRVYHNMTELYKCFRELREIADFNKVNKIERTYQFILFNEVFFDITTDKYIVSEDQERYKFCKNIALIYDREWEEFRKWLQLI